MDRQVSRVHTGLESWVWRYENMQRRQRCYRAISKAINWESNEPGLQMRTRKQKEKGMGTSGQ